MYICFMQKELLKGTLSSIILKLLLENDRMYGYQLSQAIKEITDGAILVKEGSLYPALFKLKDDGLVTTEEEKNGKRVRRYYSLTNKGHEETKQRINLIFEHIQLLQKIFNGYETK